MIIDFCWSLLIIPDYSWLFLNGVYYFSLFLIIPHDCWLVLIIAHKTATVADPSPTHPPPPGFRLARPGVGLA